MNKPLLASLALTALLLSGCTAGSDNTAACVSWADIISDWAIDGDGSDPSTTGVAIKLRTEAAPLADESLARDLRTVADAFEENSGDPTPSQERAAGNVVDVCAELGIDVN